MKRIIWGITLSILAAGSANAELLGRLPATVGGMDYQAYFNATRSNPTWLADANYANTSGYASGGGYMTWDQAQSWIDSLNAEAGGVGHLGANNWRLPRTAHQTDGGCSVWDMDGTGLSGGYGCTLSEMGHLYNVEGISSSSPGPFSNVQPGGYWSDSTYDFVGSSDAWVVNFSSGLQSVSRKVDVNYAWAVRWGDIGGAVPAPGALWLFGTALAALAGTLRRRHAGCGAE